MKKSYFPIGVYESYLVLMDRAVELAAGFGVSEWFIADSIQEFNQEVRSREEFGGILSVLKERLYRLADQNPVIVVADFDEISGCWDFWRFHGMIDEEAYRNPKLMKTLRNISATKLGINEKDGAIDSAYRYAIADMAITYDFARRGYTRLLNPRDRDIFNVATKHAGTFLGDEFRGAMDYVLIR